jgi:hypothetical protein
MRLTLSIVCGLVFAAALHAQQQPILAPAPRVTQLSPVGGKVGTTLELTVTGLDMEEPQSLWFSHPGIKSEFIPPPPPPVDPKTKEPPKQPPPRNPTVPHATKFKVTIAPDVPLGIHDVRVVNSKGISNPRAFVVGDLTEVLEKEGNNDIGEAQKIELNCTVNGSFANATDVDLFAFTGKAKQRVVISCLASSIDSRARPLIEVYRPDGIRLAANRNYHYTDALADVTLPADGEYYIRLSEFTYLGVTAEHFYRLSVTTGPWIDAVFPSVLVPGQANTVTIYGRNLPGGQPDPTAQADGQVLEKMQTTITPPGDPASRSKLAYSGAIHSRSTGVDGFEFRLSSPVGKSNPGAVELCRAAARAGARRQRHRRDGPGGAVPLRHRRSHRPGERSRLVQLHGEARPNHHHRAVERTAGYAGGLVHAGTQSSGQGHRSGRTG